MTTPTESDSPPAFDLNSPEWYLNRELTWLSFNQRVLNEARDDRNPLLERVFFVAVVGSNLDEFFMKRIGGLKQQVGAGVKTRSVDGMLPQEQLDVCHQRYRDMLTERQQIEAQLHRQLQEQHICFRRYDALTPPEQQEMDEYFKREVFPLMTPQGIDPAHPFPFISNLSINLLVETGEPTAKRVFLNRVKVPNGVGIPRFIQVGRNNHYITFEDLVANNLDDLFPGLKIHRSELFRVTRNAITERAEEQANDLLAVIESALRDRKFADIVRLEVDADMLPQHRGMLAFELGIHEHEDVFEILGLLAKRDLMEIYKIDRPGLHYPIHHPCDHAQLVMDDPNIFHIIRKQQSILLQHPYESFDTSVGLFLEQASTDPKVLVIKMTLYRTGSHSRIIQCLIDAAQNGKQVAVVVELQARFDESANIKWAQALEEAGIHVTYGVLGLKTHSKVIFVVRRDYNGLQRYAHIGTGNYHAGTARQYSDLGLLTNDPIIGEDLNRLFNYLTTGYAPAWDYRKILPSPKILKKGLLARIDREIEHHTPEQPGLIQFKTNALEDKDITRALYRASQAGVHVDLIVRDSCRLRPGIPGLSDNIRVVSIIGRFLEHARIYYFKNGGEAEYFIGSADLMKRNLEARVEVVIPVEEKVLQATLHEILDIQIDNQRSVWDMQPDGTYIQRRPDRQADPRTVHEILIDLAESRLAASSAIKKKRAGKSVGRKRNVASKTA
jgi:polyphosphate kinase